MLLDLVSLYKKYNMNIKGVIHIGAHFGEENSVYDKLEIKNRIFFEPLQSNFLKLKENVDNKYKFFQKALGNENKKITMFVETANSGQSCSLLKPFLHLKQYPSITFDKTEEVEMTRLDDIEYELNNYNFINIDVQGYELEVFKGGFKTLEKIDYIMSEINSDYLYENCVLVKDLDEFLSQFGFIRKETFWAGGTWGDALYIKE